MGYGTVARRRAATMWRAGCAGGEEDGAGGLHRRWRAGCAGGLRTYGGRRLLGKKEEWKKEKKYF
jgi:hypothetical protein